MPQPRFQRQQGEHRFVYVNGRLRRRRARRRGCGRSRFARIFGPLQDPTPAANVAEFSVEIADHNPTITAPPRSATHRDRRQAAEQAWANCRSKALDSFIDAHYSLDSATCSVCNCNDIAVYRCLDCRSAKYCSIHVISEHQGKLHVPDQWKVILFYRQSSKGKIYI